MRTIFSTVLAPQLPAFTVGSLAMTATWRPSIVPSPVTTPSAGRSSAITFANNPSSTNEPSSSRMASRSRAVSLCCSRSLGRYLVPPLSAFSRSSRSRSLISPALEIWFPLLKEGLDTFLRVLGLGHQRELAVEVVEGGTKFHVLLAGVGIAAQPQRDRRLSGELGGEVFDRGVELIVRDDPVDHPKRLQLRRRPAVAEHLHLQQDLARDVCPQDGLNHPQ